MFILLLFVYILFFTVIMLSVTIPAKLNFSLTMYSYNLVAVSPLNLQLISLSFKYVGLCFKGTYSKLCNIGTTKV